MKKIDLNAIDSLNDIIVELPPFTELKSKENIKEVLNEFLKDIYLDKPQELFDVLDFKLSEKMQELFFTNYGIDKKYSRNLKGGIKKDLAYHLEVLFQNKGSKVIFRLFSQIFENIFRKINFYNIEVHKIPTVDGFRFEYKLDPVYITDQSKVIKRPQMPVDKTRKYLMDLENFKDYTAWPVPTNLIYIQFSIGEEVINNMDTFLNGIRSYATSYLFGASFKYKDSRGDYENIYMPDLEFILTYFHLEWIKHRVPELTYDYPDRVSSYLMYNEDDGDVRDFLCAMQNLIFDYMDADYSDRNAMEALRRRWYHFLKTRERDVADQVCHLKTFDDIKNKMIEKYPRMQKDIEEVMPTSEEESHEPLFELLLKIYASFISGVYTNQRVNDPDTPENEGGCGQLPGPRSDFQLKWVLDYVDAVFGGLFMQEEFLKYYFNPVMDLFIRYFFPVEMEYINDLVKKVFLKDKWNTIGTSEERLLMVNVNRTSIQTPIRGIDYRKYWIFMTNVHSYIDKISLPSTVTSIPVKDDYPDPDDEIFTTVFSTRRHESQLSDIYDVKITHNGTLYTRVSYRFQLPDFLSRTKDYQVEGSLKLIEEFLDSNH